MKLQEILNNIPDKKSKENGAKGTTSYKFKEDLDSFFGVNLQDAQKFTTQDVQENQQAIVLLEAAMANKGDLRNFEVLKGDLIMSKDGRIVKSDNAFFDLISSNEGFEGSFYDAAKGYLSGGWKGQFGKEVIGIICNKHQNLFKKENLPHSKRHLILWLILHIWLTPKNMECMIQRLVMVSVFITRKL